MKPRKLLPLVPLMALVLIAACGKKNKGISEDEIMTVLDKMNDICSNPTDVAFDEIFDPGFMSIDQAKVDKAAAEAAEAAGEQPVEETPVEELTDEEAAQVVNEFRRDYKQNLLWLMCDPNAESFTYQVNEIVVANDDTTYVNMRFKDLEGVCRMEVPPGEARVSVLHQVGKDIADQVIFYFKRTRDGVRIYGVRKSCDD